jgi:outer membrane protein W
MVMGVIAAACLSQSARAAEGDWLFRAGASMIDPKNPNIEDPFNGAPFNEGDIVYDDSVSAAASVAYMLTDHLATELWLAWPFNLDVSLKSQEVAGDMGEVELLAPLFAARKIEL